MPVNTKSTESSPVQRDTVMERIAERLEAMVRSGELVRGSRLPSEPRLAAMLKVSRASLREALKGMMFLGLLTAKPGDGTYVQPSLSSMVSRHFQWMLLLHELKYFELYELRQILEPAAAALAARRATPDDLQQMKTALAAMKSARDPDSFIAAEMDFHFAIMQSSKNAAIQSSMKMMYGALQEGRHRVLPLVGDLKQHCAKHQRIFSLIAARDVSGARRAVTDDLKFAERLLFKALEGQEQSLAAGKECVIQPLKGRSAKKKTTTSTSKKRPTPSRRQS